MSNSIGKARHRQNRAQQHNRPTPRRNMADDAAAMQAQINDLQARVDEKRAQNKATVERLQAQGIGVMAQGIESRALAKMVSGNNAMFLLGWEMQVELDMEELLKQGDSPEMQEAVRKARLTEGVGPVTPEMEQALRDEHGGVLLAGPKNGQGPG